MCSFVALRNQKSGTMKLIKSLLLLISLLCCHSILAEGKVIILNDINHNDEWVEDERSITINPIATIEGNTIRIYSNITIENVSIVIKDQSDNVIYSNTSIVNSRCHTFEVFDLLKDDYILELKIGNDSFYGCFSN